MMEYPLFWGKLSLLIPATPSLRPSVMDFSMLVSVISVLLDKFFNHNFLGSMEKLLMTFVLIGWRGG